MVSLAELLKPMTREQVAAAIGRNPPPGRAIDAITEHINATRAKVLAEHTVEAVTMVASADLAEPEPQDVALLPECTLVIGGKVV